MGKIAGPFRHVDHLGLDLIGGLEGGMDVPQRASAAEARKRKAPGAEAFRDIPGPVHPHEEEGDAAHLRASQRIRTAMN